MSYVFQSSCSCIQATKPEKMLQKHSNSYEVLPGCVTQPAFRCSPTHDLISIIDQKELKFICKYAVNGCNSLFLLYKVAYFWCLISNITKAHCKNYYIFFFFRNKKLISTHHANHNKYQVNTHHHWPIKLPHHSC